MIDWRREKLKGRKKKGKVRQVKPGIKIQREESTENCTGWAQIKFKVGQKWAGRKE